MDSYRRRLIECVKERPPLWDPKDPDYKNKEDRKLLWEGIDEVLKPPEGVNVTGRQIWETLSRGFSNALRRKNRRSGKGGEYELEWKFESDMMFLIPAKQMRNFHNGRFDSSSMDDVTDTTPEELDAYSGDEDSSCKSLIDQAHVTKHELEMNHLIEDIETARESDHNMDHAATRRFISPKYHRNNNVTGKNKRKYAKISHDEDEEVAMINEKYRDDSNDVVMMKLRQEAATASTATSATNAVERSPRLGFFLSLMPIVDSLDEDHFMELQLEVIQALKKQRKASRSSITVSITHEEEEEGEEEEEPTAV